jgi:hypothetical protein
VSHLSNDTNTNTNKRMFRSLCVVALVANMATVAAFSPQSLPAMTSRSHGVMLMRATVEKDSMVEAAAATPSPEHAAVATPKSKGE